MYVGFNGNEKIAKKLSARITKPQTFVWGFVDNIQQTYYFYHLINYCLVIP